MTKKTFIIAGDFNTVLNEKIDKRNGRIDTHKRCRTVINSIIDAYSLTDIWRDMHPDLMQYNDGILTTNHLYFVG